MSKGGSTEERADLEILRGRINQTKIDTFEYLKSFARDITPELVRASGYQSVEDAFVKIMKRRMDEIEKMIRAHEKKYPD
jgi:hypothetical protein